MSLIKFFITYMHLLSSLTHKFRNIQAWDRKYLKKEEDNLASKRIDRAGGGCGRGAGTVGTFGIFGIKNSCFNAFYSLIFGRKKKKSLGISKSVDPRRNLMPEHHIIFL